MNPYEVLGVAPGASKEEIHAAYRNKVKKYHPDRYLDESLKVLAEEKLKEINLAYDTLTKEETTLKPVTNAYSGKNGYSNESKRDYQYRGPYMEYFAHVRSALQRRDYFTAKRILDSIPTHNAEWFYLMGHYYFQQRQYDAARRHYALAVSLDGDNLNYRRAYESARNVAAHTKKSDSNICGEGDAGRKFSICCGSSLVIYCFSQFCFCDI